MTMLLLAALSWQDIPLEVPPDILAQSRHVYAIVPTIRLGILPVWLVQPVPVPNPFYRGGPDT